MITMNRKIISTIFLFICIVLSFLVDNLFTSIGGIDYFYFPFPMKVTTCGSALGANLSCEYPYVWWGLFASIFFWLIVIRTYAFAAK